MEKPNIKQYIEWLDKRVQLSAGEKDYVIFAMQEYARKHHESKVKNLGLFSVSKRFEIDFDGNVLAGIEITNNEPKVFGAMNGCGDVINPDKCKITEKTD